MLQRFLRIIPRRRLTVPQSYPFRKPSPSFPPPLNLIGCGYHDECSHFDSYSPVRQPAAHANPIDKSPVTGTESDEFNDKWPSFWAAECPRKGTTGQPHHSPTSEKPASETMLQPEEEAVEQQTKHDKIAPAAAPTY